MRTTHLCLIFTVKMTEKTENGVMSTDEDTEDTATDEEGVEHVVVDTEAEVCFVKMLGLS